MAFSNQFLDELRSRVGIVSVVGKKVALKRHGREHMGLCPFHNEKTPSFTVSEEKGFYHCFGCGAHGSAIDFVMETENLSFPEAVERLAAEAGMEVPQDSPQERARAERAKGLYDVMEAAARFFEKQLRMPEGKRALAYLLDRGLSEETIRAFRLGFAPDGRGVLKSALAADGIREDQMVEAGLVIRPEDNNRAPYDRFRGRVMFPILDSRGRVIAFGGRVLGDGEPKYLNSPETPLFHKGRQLYALTQAREHVRNEPIVVVEGYTDVLALHQAGLRTAVAPLGTALTEDQIKLIWRFSRGPVLCFDGDKAGERAASRAAERALPLLTPGYSLSFAFLPEGEDPDSLVRTRGIEAMRKTVAKAAPLSQVLWRMETAGQRLDTPEERAWLEKRLKDHAFRIADETVRSHYLSDIRDRMWQLARASKQQAGQQAQKSSTFAGKGGQSRSKVNTGVSTGAQEVKVDRLVLRERILLATLITHPELFDEVAEPLGYLAFSAPELDNLRQEVLKTLAGRADLDFEGLSSHLINTGYSGLLRGLLSRQVYHHASFARPDEPFDVARKGWEQVLRLYERDRLLAEIRAVEERLGNEPNDADFQRLIELKKQQQVQEEDRPDIGYSGSRSTDAA